MKAEDILDGLRAGTVNETNGESYIKTGGGIRHLFLKLFTLILPSRTFRAVTPSDTDNIAGGRAASLYIGGAGDVSVVNADGQNVVFVGVPAGATLVIDTHRVNETGTTATDIVAL